MSHTEFNNKEISDIYLTRREVFAASHRLHSPTLSDEENKRLFDKCNNFHGHGHNYILEVTIKGKPDPVTGMIINLVDMKQIILKEVIDKVDHYNLNFDVPEFRTDCLPSTENMIIIFWKWLAPHFADGMLYKLKLMETENNWAEYYGPN